MSVVKLWRFVYSQLLVSKNPKAWEYNEWKINTSLTFFRRFIHIRYKVQGVLKCLYAVGVFKKSNIVKHKNFVSVFEMKI